MKQLFKYILCLACFALVSQSGYGQWKFEIYESVLDDGKPFGLGLVVAYVGFFSTKTECEAERAKRKMATKGSMISPCFGSDLIQNNQGTSSNGGGLNLYGPGQGKAYNSTNPSTATQDWIDNEILRQQLQNNLNNPATGSGFSTAKTGDKGFDDEWLRRGGTEFKMVYKKTGKKTGKAIEIGGLNVNNGQEYTSLEDYNSPFTNPFFNKTNEIKQQMRELIEEREQLERFCESPYLNCSDYQQRMSEIDNLLNETKGELSNGLGEYHKTELAKQQQELEKREKNKSECKDIFCERAQEKAIKETEEKISEIEKKLEGVENEVNRIENIMEKTASNISDLGKRDEIADEKFRKINEQSDNGEILKVQASFMRQEVYNEKTAIAVERGATNVYNYSKDFVQEVKETLVVIKDMALGTYSDNPDVRNAEMRTISSTYGVLSALTPDGPSQIFGILSDGGKQLANNGSVSSSTLVKNSVAGTMKDKVIEKTLGDYAPIYSKASKMGNITKESIDGAGSAIDWYKAVANERQNNTTK